MSWRRFNGWEPRSVTTTEHEYDDTGRLVRSVATTVTEPEWDDKNRAWSIALVEYEHGLCGSCNNPLAITTDPGMEGRYVHDGFKVCHHCAKAEQAHEKYANSKFLRPSTLKHLIRPLLPDPSMRRPGG